MLPIAARQTRAFHFARACARTFSRRRHRALNHLIFTTAQTVSLPQWHRWTDSSHVRRDVKSGITIAREWPVVRADELSSSLYRPLIHLMHLLLLAAALVSTVFGGARILYRSVHLSVFAIRFSRVCGTPTPATRSSNDTTIVGLSRPDRTVTSFIRRRVTRLTGMDLLPFVTASNSFYSPFP